MNSYIIETFDTRDGFYTVNAVTAKSIPEALSFIELEEGEEVREVINLTDSCEGVRYCVNFE